MSQTLPKTPKLRLTWPLSAEQVGTLDQMIADLYKRLSDAETVSSSTTVSATGINIAQVMARVILGI